jgi:hypothetical protein
MTSVLYKYLKWQIKTFWTTRQETNVPGLDLPLVLAALPRTMMFNGYLSLNLLINKRASRSSFSLVVLYMCYI